MRTHNVVVHAIHDSAFTKGSGTNESVSSWHQAHRRSLEGSRAKTLFHVAVRHGSLQLITQAARPRLDGLLCDAGKRGLNSHPGGQCLSFSRRAKYLYFWLFSFATVRGRIRSCNRFRKYDGTFRYFLPQLALRRECIDTSTTKPANTGHLGLHPSFSAASDTLAADT